MGGPEIEDLEKELPSKDGKSSMKRKTDFCKQGNREFWEKKNVVYWLNDEIERANKKHSYKRSLKKTHRREVDIKPCLEKRAPADVTNMSTGVSEDLSFIKKKLKSESSGLTP